MFAPVVTHFIYSPNVECSLRARHCSKRERVTNRKYARLMGWSLQACLSFPRAH